MSDPVSPTTFSPALSKEFNATVYLKPEIHSATGSYKDRMAAAAVAEALQAGASEGGRDLERQPGHRDRPCGAGRGHSPGSSSPRSTSCPSIATNSAPRRRLADRARHEGPLTAAFHERVAEGYFPLSVVPEDRGRQVAGGQKRLCRHRPRNRRGPRRGARLPDPARLLRRRLRGHPAGLPGNGARARHGIPKFLMVRATNAEDVAFSITADITTPEVAATLEATRGVSMYFPNRGFPRRAAHRPRARASISNPPPPRRSSRCANGPPIPASPPAAPSSCCSRPKHRDAR